MTPEYSINPFDTQLGCRYPTPQERSFLVNFMTLLATPVGEEKAYDGIADMCGMVIDELYKNLADENSPNKYTSGIETAIDQAIEDILIEAREFYRERGIISDEEWKVYMNTLEFEA